MQGQFVHATNAPNQSSKNAPDQNQEPRSEPNYFFIHQTITHIPLGTGLHTLQNQEQQTCWQSGTIHLQ
jgi:hypothetical protein